jgi:ribosomal protein L21E
MQIEQILNYCFPFTDEDLTDDQKKQEKTFKRDRLRRMVDQYKHGDIVNFDALNISVDIEEILKRFEN